MGKSYKFEIGEITISRQEADLLRYRILDIAKSKDIGTVPFQYERLLLDINRKMQKLNAEIVFWLDGSQVDFTQPNFAMFKTKVLRALLSIKKENDHITLQTKNLDILSFYAFEMPWKEYIQKHNNKDDFHNGINNFQEYPTKNKTLKIIFSSIFILLLTSLAYIFYDYVQLKNFFYEREIKYHSALTSLTEEYKKNINFDNKYYDTLTLPIGNYLARIKFDDDLKYYNKYPCRYEIIKSNTGASIKSQPGLKYCSKFDHKKVLGFGLRNCISQCYKTSSDPYYRQPNCTILRIKFDKKYFLTYITFKWIEVGHNWGSTGKVFVNGKPLGNDPYQTLGNFPPSNMLEDDDQIKRFTSVINEYSDQIDLAVWDIANESEIYINDIDIWGR